MKVLIVISTILAISVAVPILVQNEDGDLFELTPVLTRERRQAQLFGGGGFQHRNGGGTIGIQNPNGSGGQFSYGHQKGIGQSFGADVMVPVWSKKSKYGETTLNVGGGADYWKGLGGNQFTDKRVGAVLNHRF
ncbi:hypothetical protein GWI33_020373 [Rhynchophorus ferrugineus]|uniref:Uncharacterized protein n=1 Tax=Rhynchophorus ferrugineus TaxID=354439 RepID=A0A834HPP2_RHYFE|nr:hypothetical protein GWI33_020373 [Rhynchophorus ferrugineus]